MLTRRAKRTCLRCNAEYVPKASNRITYCSRACAYAHKTEQRIYREAHLRAARDAKIQQRYACAICGARSERKRCSRSCQREYLRREQRQYDEAKSQLRRGRPHQCKECGVTFTPSYGQKFRIFCSYGCSHRHAKRLRRARARGATTMENFSAREIFARDLWTCWICGDRVARDAAVPDPLSPTLDHVLPLARGGAHTRANVRCAHFVCNCRRGAAA